MKRIIHLLLISTLTFSVLGQTDAPIPNVLNLRNSPNSSSEQGLSAFFDLGSWMRFSISEDKNSTDFAGLYLLGLDHGLWASNDFVHIDLVDGAENSILIGPEASKQTYLPGKLMITFNR